VTQTLDAAGSPFGPPDDLLHRLLDPARIADRQARADRLLGAEGAGHLVHDLPVRADGRSASIESRPWRLDPVPVVLESATFGWLAAAIAERMDALEAVLVDLYGERSLVQDRVVPAEALASTGRYRLNAVGERPRRWLTSYSVDVALDTDGAWHVVQDLTDAPPGLGYALLDRSVMARVVPDVFEPADIASLTPYTGAVRRALDAASGVDSPRTVVFSGGIDHPSYIDHSYLAVELGVNLVEGADLVVRRRRVWLRTLDGLEPVDVLFRRLDDPAIDPLEVGAQGSAGVPGLLQAVRSGGVALANAHGAGVIESDSFRPYLEAAIAATRPPAASLTMLSAPTPDLTTVPLAPGSVAPGVRDAAVVVRLFAVHDGHSVTVLPGGTGRVLAPGDDPRVPTACTAKDVWVLGRSSTPSVTPRLPQVDFGRSVPTRAADALYWTNRSAERAEAMARTVRVIASRIERDPLGHDGERWARRMAWFAAAIRRDSQWEPAAATDLDLLHAELSAVGDEVAVEIGTLLTEATTVREFLSVTTGRVLAHLAELRASLQQHRTGVDDLDAVLADFAAMAGLWQESTVRGPAWTIGDAGRRLERALVVLDLVEATLGGEPDPPEIGAAAIEVLLAATESLVAYRRRHRSEVELDAALHIVLHDVANPRSLAAAVVDLERHAAESDWPVVEELAARAAAALALPLPELLVEARAAIVDAGARVVERWFSTPVNPIVMRPTGGGR
jgi:uncharacterized circularly permuted ATP-grasp superfamily protein/uncharacterized alpha-E superfamily protein